MTRLFLVLAFLAAMFSSASAQMVQLPVPCIPLVQKEVMLNSEGMKLIASADSRRKAKLELWRAESGKYAIIHVVNGMACFLDLGKDFKVSIRG